MMEAADETAGKTKLPDFDSLWDYDHPGATERKFREFLPAALDSRDFPYLTQLLTQIARAEGLQRKFQDAHETLDRVEKALLKAEADDKTKVRYLLERVCDDCACDFHVGNPVRVCHSSDEDILVFHQASRFSCGWDDLGSSCM